MDNYENKNVRLKRWKLYKKTQTISTTKELQMINRLQTPTS
jgi:hypothetical protein